MATPPNEIIQKPEGIYNPTNTLQEEERSRNLIDFDISLNSSEGTASDYLNSFPQSGADMSDLVLQTEGYNKLGQEGLQQLKGFQPNGVSITGGSSIRGTQSFNADKALENVMKASSGKPSIRATATPSVISTSVQDFERYKDSDKFQTFGYVPSLGKEQEYKYGRAMTWGDTMSNALAGGGILAADTFVEGWKGWGRMFDALVNWDASKLYGDEMERYQMAKKQEEVFNKYAIYNTEQSEDSIFNRQFFGNMLQQAGFTVGAIGQMVVENFITGGLGSVIGAASKSLMVAKGLKNATNVAEIIDDMRKVQNVVSKQERIVNSLKDLSKNLIPLYGTVDDIIKLNKAGAGALQLASLGVGGIKRELSMFNMARSEAIFESASTYKDLHDKLAEEYYNATGQPPSGEQLEKIRQTAENASHDNFYTNVGILSLMNKVQFGNMVSGFNPTRKLFSQGASFLADDAFSVTGKVAGKTFTKAYEKGILGSLGSVGDIAKTFGKKKAAWEVAKFTGKGLMKFEGSEGVQELIQEASNKGLSDYHYDLYHGAKGYGSSKFDNIYDSIKNPLTDFEGMKTFLMGALTGRLIAPFSSVTSYVTNRKEITDRKAKAKEAVALVNTLYSDPSKYMAEWIANTKVQNKAAETMEEAVKNRNEYVFHNVKDSAFAKAVAASIQLNMYDSLKNTIKEFGQEFSDSEFKEAFKLEATDGNKKNASEFMNSIANKVEDYYTLYTNLKDKYGDKIVADLYKNNDPEDYEKMQLAKKAVDMAIEMLATNSYKARRVVERAANLQEQIASNQNIGGSALNVLTNLGSEKNIELQMMILQAELAQLDGIPGLTDDQKKILRDKKEEYKLVTRWKNAFDKIISAESEDYNDSVESEAYNSYKDLINLYNTRAGLTSIVSKEDMDENFLKFTDYILLGRDGKSYIDAMNLLADPSNMHLIANLSLSSMANVADVFKKEHIKEIESKVEEKPKEEEEEKTPDVISDEIYNDFIDKGVVSDDILNTIADKIISKTPLSERENAIFTAKTAEINEIIKQKAEAEGTEPPPPIDYINLYLEKIKNAKDIDELDRLVAESEKFISIDDSVLLVPTIEEMNDKFEKLLATTTLMRMTDPEFVKEYNAIISIINNLQNKEDLTQEEVNTAFRSLNPLLNKLVKEDKDILIQKHKEQKQLITNELKIQLESKNLDVQKGYIDKVFVDNKDIINIFDKIVTLIDLTVHPSIKKEVIEYFEKKYNEYANNILKQVEKNLNKSVTNKITDIIEKEVARFRDQIQKSIDKVIKNIQELSEKTKGITLNTEYNPDFITFVHGRISDDRDAGGKSLSVEQERAIKNLIATKILVEGELASFGISYNGESVQASRLDASEAINAGVARIYTIKLNNKIQAYATSLEKKKKNPDNSTLKGLVESNLKSLIDEYTQYLKEGFSYLNDTEMKDTIDLVMAGALDNEESTESLTADQIVDDFIILLDVPKTENISDAEYKLLNEFAKNIVSQNYDIKLSDYLKGIELASEKLVTTDRDGKIQFTKYFDELLEGVLSSFKVQKGSPLYKSITSNLIANIDNINNAKTKDEVIKIIDEVVFAKTPVIPDRKKLDAIKVMMATFNAIIKVQNDSIIDPNDESTTALTEDEIEKILINPTSRSINEDQFEEIKKYALIDLLEKVKSKFNAAIGFRKNPISFGLDQLEEEVGNDSPSFSSLRQKFADDTRDRDDLIKEAGIVDGRLSLVKALEFVSRSKYATASEKFLANQLLSVATDDYFIKIDDTSPEAGYYDSESDEISINLQAASFSFDNPSVPLETVIIHEFLHKLTATELTKPGSEFRKNIKNLYDVIAADPRSKSFYAYLDDLSEEEKLAEFIVEAFTNPSFQYLLGNTKYKNTQETIWQRLLKILNFYLRKLGVTTSDNVLNEVINQTGLVLEALPKIVRKTEEKEEKPIESEEDIKERDKRSKVYNKLYNDIVGATTAAQLSRILNKVKDTYIFLQKSLPADLQEAAELMSSKLDAVFEGESLVKAVKAKRKTLKEQKASGYNLTNKKIIVEGKIYKYWFNPQTNKFEAFRLSRVGPRIVTNTVLKEKIIKAVLKDTKKISDLLTEQTIREIEYLAGSAIEYGTYASKSMPDTTVGQMYFSSFYNMPDLGSIDQIAIGFNFNSKEEYQSFIKRYRLAKRKKGSLKRLALDKLKNDYPRQYREIDEVITSLGSIGDVTRLVENGKIAWGKGYTVTEVEYSSNGGDMRELLKFYLTNGNLNTKTTDYIRNEINTVLLNAFGIVMPYSLQQDIEDKLFFENYGFEEKPPLPPAPPVIPQAPEKDPNPNIVDVSSTLKPEDVKKDPSIFNPTSVPVQRSARPQQSYALRSIAKDIESNGEETGYFKEYYYKIRNIINKLSVMDPEKHINLYVTLAKDNANLRWDGSEGFAGSGVIAYLSDDKGNPIVFNQNGDQIAKLDRNNLSDKKGLDVNDNQIVYFFTPTEKSKDKFLSDPVSFNKMMEARANALNGKPQIARVINFSQGVMNNKTAANIEGLGRRKQNTKDPNFLKQIKQKHVKLDFRDNKFLFLMIEGSDGSMTEEALFPEHTRYVSFTSNQLPGQPKMQAFDYMLELMKTYHEMRLRNDPSTTDVGNNLNKFLRNFWFTSDKTFRIQSNLHTVEIKDRKTGQLVTLHLFQRDDLTKTVTQAPDYIISQARNYINNREVNIYKKWLSGAEEFLVPGLVEENGNKKIVFEKKDYTKFLLEDVGLLTTIYEIKPQNEIKRYHSQVHFAEPTNLDVETIEVPTEEDIVDNENAIEDVVKNEVVSEKPAEAPKELTKIKKKGRWAAPKKENIYQKICK